MNQSCPMPLVTDKRFKREEEARRVRGKLLNAALETAARGIPVFPVHGISNGNCTCGQLDCTAQGKHPRIRFWPNEASTDPKQIQDWWAKWHYSNIGLLMGRRAGIFCLDVDGPIGDDSLSDLQEREGKLPDTWESRTGRGKHLFFRYPQDGESLHSTKMASGLDIKADCGYVVGPGSIHISGKEYQWELSSSPDQVTLAEPPSWLVDLIRDRKRHESASQPDGRKKGSNWCTEIPEGARGTTLFKRAVHYRDRGHSLESTTEALLGINSRWCVPPLAEKEVHKIVESAYAYEPRKSWDPNGLSPNQQRVYEYLRSLGPGTHEITIATIQEGTGIQPRTIQRAIKRLTEKGMVSVWVQGGKANRYAVNRTDAEVLEALSLSGGDMG